MCCFSIKYTIFWYSALLQMHLQEQQCQTKNKSYYTNYLDERPYYRLQISI